MVSTSDLAAEAGTVTGTEIVSLTPGPIIVVATKPVESSQPRTLEIEISNLSDASPLLVTIKVSDVVRPGSVVLSAGVDNSAM